MIWEAWEVWEEQEAWIRIKFSKCSSVVVADLEHLKIWQEIEKLAQMLIQSQKVLKDLVILAVCEGQPT